jgi:hypothetical protein
VLAAGVLGSAGCGIGRESLAEATAPATVSTPPPNSENMQSALKVKFTIGSEEAAATLHDTATARDFASLLPLTITMGDLFGREKPGQLPRELAPGGTHQFTYSVGDVAYWAPRATSHCPMPTTVSEFPVQGSWYWDESIQSWR